MKRYAAQYVYTGVDPEPIRNGFVEVSDDGAIVTVGQCAEVSKAQDFQRNAAIVPGFVNAHCHIELSFLKGRFRKETGMAGFIDQINALRTDATQAERVAAISEAMDALWAQGTVAMADISNGDESFAVKAAHPLWTRTFVEVFGADPAACGAIMADCEALCEKAKAMGLAAAPTPHACYTTSPELLTASSVAAIQSGFLSYHSEESMQEDQLVREGRGALWENRRALGIPVPPPTGDSSLRYFLDRLAAGVSLPVEAHVLLVHECCLDAAGIRHARAALRHPFLCLCPQSNRFIQGILPPVRLMRGSGIPLCVGTDSLSSNDSLSMVAELFCLQQAFPEIPLGEMVGWACRNGAAFLGRLDTLGTLEVGKRPGLALITAVEEGGRLTTESKSVRL